MISFKNVQIGYEHPLLKVNFNKLDAGNAYALVGTNGSGKSTFLKTVAGFCPVNTGEILLNNLQLNELKSLEKSKKIAFVTSRFPEAQHIKVVEFIGLGRTPYLNAFGRLQASDLEQVNKAIEALKIEHLQNKFTHELSDGEKQLCAIAQAICQETSVILLDEPTSFLDYKNRDIIISQLKALAFQFSKCIIYSSHDLDVVIEQGQGIIYANPNQKALHLSFDQLTKNELISLMEGE